MQVVNFEKVRRQVSLDIIVFERIAVESKLLHDVLRSKDGPGLSL